MNSKVVNIIFVIVLVIAAGLFGVIMLQDNSPDQESAASEEVVEISRHTESVDPVVLQKADEVVEVAAPVVNPVKQKAKIVEEETLQVVEKLPIDSDAEKREFFQKSIANLSDLARDGDFYAFMQVAFEPGTQLYQNMINWKDQMEQADPGRQGVMMNHTRKLMGQFADKLDELVWDDLNWVDGEVSMQVPYGDNYFGEGRLYQANGHWYVKGVDNQ